MSSRRSDHLLMPITAKPALKQVGLNVHGARRKERYVMDNLWSLHLYRWSGALEIGGRSFEINPGSVSVEPPNTPLTWRYDNQSCPHHYAHFALAEGGVRTRVPIMQQTGPAFTELWEEMEGLIGLFGSHPLRAEVRLWDLLLRLSVQQNTKKPAVTGLPFAVQTAVAIIENEMARAPRVAELARRVGLSHNQLTRLFNETFGQGVAAYIRKRRLEKAQHLLSRSNLPIKAVAAEVGLPDLQQFNKFMRKETGAPPRRLRSEQERASR